jgi:hypothetical protein
MWTWIKSLDRLLRGESTGLQTLRAGKLEIPAWGLLVLINLLGGIYGICMGLFSITPGGSGHGMQIVAAMVKTPALFLLTLLVTFPSLYVFNALVGSSILLPSVWKLLVGSLSVMLSILSSLGTVVAFFSFTTTSYPFMVLLNVAVFSIAGLLGLSFLLQTLHRISIASAISVIEKMPPASLPEGENTGPLHKPTEQLFAPQVKLIFRIWVVVFGLVGAQMSWILRPFVGHPGMPFTWFRHTESNFFQAVLNSFLSLLSK